MVSIRLASNEDADRIKELVAPKIDLDWTDIYPYWLVAETDKIVGCINLCLSKPIGVLDQLAVDSSLNSHTRSRVVRALILQGLSTLKAAGASAAVSMVPFELKPFKRVLKKHFGSVVVNQGNIIFTRVQ